MSTDIQLTRMGSGNSTYPYKKKLPAGSPPVVIRKAKDGGVLRQETPQEKLARYQALYGAAGAQQKLQQEAQDAANNTIIATPKRQGYEPTQAVKNTKAWLAGSSLATSSNPMLSYLPSVAGAVYDFGTAARYAADGNWDKATEDAFQGALGLLPGFKGVQGLKGEWKLNQAQKAANAALRTGQVGSDASQINEAFKYGGQYMAEGGDVDPIQQLIKSSVPMKKVSKTTKKDNTPVRKYDTSMFTDTMKPVKDTFGDTDKMLANQVAANASNPIKDRKGIEAQVKKYTPEVKKARTQELKDLGYTGSLLDMEKQKFNRDSIVREGSRVDASTANAIRTGLGILPKNAQQMIAKRVFNEARMDENSLSDEEKLVLWNTIQNASKRTGKPQGGTEYEDYQGENGTKEDFNNWFNKGKVNAWDLIGKSSDNPGFRVASTVGRGKYFKDPETGDVVYTDVYDWNTREKNFKGEGIYQNLRNNMRASEDKNLNKNKNEKYRMNMILRKDDIDRIRQEQEDNKNTDLSQMSDTQFMFKKGGMIRKYATGGPIEDPNNPPVAPKGYKPLSRDQRQQWNSFVRYLNKDAKVGGSKDLDNRTNATGLNYLKQYAKDNPGFSITPEMVPYVQYEFQQLKNTNSLPGVNPTGRVKTLISDYFTNRDISDTDGWIGSLTSRQGYPVITEFTDDPQKRFWNLDYEGASQYENDVWNKKKTKPTPGMKYGGDVDTEDVWEFNRDTTNNMWYPALPEAKTGIYIKPSKRGTFTAAATKHGKSVQAFAAQVLANKENYSPAMVKKANFARNAAKWHEDGGIVENDFMDVDENLYDIPVAKTGIHINPANKGKFTATKKRTGKSTEELTHSKNPLTRKRAIFAQNAKKWHKGEYGLEVMADGGMEGFDPTDPMFAQKLQEFVRNNPDALSDIFNPSTSSTPPGVSADQQINIQPNNISQMAWADDDNLPQTQSPDVNTNEQQTNPGRSNKRVKLPIGDILSGAVQGLDALATKYIDEPRKRANEMRLLRKQLAPVISKPSQGGYDMPILAKSGVQITSAYTDNTGVPSATRPTNPFGNVANNFKTDPSQANVLVEGGEFLELPDGQTSNITGDKHSDYSGGEFMRLPEGAKVYSDSIKVDKDFHKDLTGSSSKKRKTVADIAKKFNTDHEEKILQDTTADTISKRSANIMKTFKQGQLKQLFDYQESVKDPMYMLNKEQGAEDFMGSDDTVVAKNGVKIMADGGDQEDPRKKVLKAPAGQRYFRPGVGMVDNPAGATFSGRTATDIPMPPDGSSTPTPSQPLWWMNVGRTLPTVEVKAKRTQPQGSQQPWWMNIQPTQGAPYNPLTPEGQRALVQRPSSTPKLTTPLSTPDSTPDWTPMDLQPIRGKYVLNTLPEGVQPPQLQPLKAPTTIQPGDTPVDPNKPDKPIPDNNKANPPQPSPKVPWGDTLNSLGELTPEIFAMIQNQTDFPIFTAKYQPKYLNPVELNIQASLNKNYAQTQPLLESTGNPAIDNARQSQAIANLYDANNQMFEQKFNFDTQNRYQTDATNLQIENEANRYNLQRADDFWNKVTARQAVKEATNNNIMNSAYAKFKRKQLEKRSLQLTNQMFDNFKYDPNRGVYFDRNGREYIFHEPSGNFVNIGSNIGDNIETTRTTRTTPKGTTQTIRQKEKKGA